MITNTNIAIFLTLIVLSQSERISFYRDPDHRGSVEVIDMTPGKCYPLYMNDVVSSINTHGYCVKIFVERNCKGRSVLFSPRSPCHTNLSDSTCEFNDQASSARLC